MIPRTLRCANAAVYATATLTVVAAAVYVLIFQEAHILRQITAIAAIIVSLIWGTYYQIKRYTIDAEGITEYRPFRKSLRLKWADLTHANLVEVQLQGVASLSIELQAPQGAITLSSRILALETVEELAQEMRENRIIT